MFRAHLRNYFVAFVATAAVTQVASATDLPIKAPPPMFRPAPVWSWNGLYIGVNLGYGIGWNRTTQSAVTPGLSAALTEDTLAPQGVVGGGQIGYNWQMAPNWVLGVEVDFQGTSQKDSSCSATCALAALDASQKMPWFGTARARLGYVHGDNLWYVTGGGAWARITSDYSIAAAPGVGASGSFTDTKGGFVVGGGVETHLGGNFTAKLEYLYMDLGTVTSTLDLPVFGPGNSLTAESKIRNNIIRVGVNYKLTP